MRFIVLLTLLLLLLSQCFAQAVTREKLLPLCFAKLVELEKSEQLEKAFHYLDKKAPSILFDARVQALCMEIFNPKGEKERVEKARQALKESGGSALLADEEFAKAFRLFAFEAKMFDKLNIHNTEAQKYYACLQISNMTKACLRVRKEVEAALEMYNLDFMAYPKAKSAKALYSLLHEKGYLRKKLLAKCPQGADIVLTFDKSGYPILRCPVHGTSAKTVNPKFPLSPPEFKMMEHSNVVIASQIELTKKHR